MVRLSKAVLCLLLWLGLGSSSALAQDEDSERELGWTNTTDLSLVITQGNSAANTLGFANRLRHTWEDARFQLDVKGVRSDTSDDRFFLADPGFEFPVGAQPEDLTFTFVTPSPTPDVANYLVGGRYDKNINEHFFWNAGSSWDRNEDAGILHRYITFGGVGNIWSETEAFQFSTSYGISYTDREEEAPDPEKDRRFAGARLGWDMLAALGSRTTFESDFTTNISVAKGSDYSINTTNSVAVSINSYLSLKVSLQFLFENDPALETGLDVKANVDLIDPDGIPSSGDEFFRTVEAGGGTIVLGQSEARKGKLDTVFRTALVITF